VSMSGLQGAEEPGAAAPGAAAPGVPAATPSPGPAR